MLFLGQQFFASKIGLMTTIWCASRPFEEDFLLGLKSVSSYFRFPVLNGSFTQQGYFYQAIIFSNSE